MSEKNISKLVEYALRFMDKVSAKGLYIILLLYFTYKSGEVPSWAKKIIIGSFAYFLSPFDSIPDLTPVLGMTDDLGVLAFGLVTIACYITEDVRLEAQKYLSRILKREIDRKVIDEVHSWL